MTVGARHVVRAVVLLVGTTCGMVGATLLLVWLATLSSFFRAVEACWLLATLLGSPYWMVPLHLRLQDPRDSSVALAFGTAIPSWLISAALAFYFHVMTFGT